MIILISFNWGFLYGYDVPNFTFNFDGENVTYICGKGVLT